MTITEITAPPLERRDLGALAEAWAAEASATEAWAAESAQRTAGGAQERRKRAERQLQDEWYDAMHAQRMAAEAFCGGGGMLNHEGLRREISEWALWTGPWSTVQKYGSEDLLWFFEHKSPRMTFSEYKRRRRAAGRIQRDEWRDRDEREATTDGRIHGDHVTGTEPTPLRPEGSASGHDHDGPGLASR